MSGYLEVKYPIKSNLSLKPFKSWKRQWCIVRPSPTRAGGGSLAVYCSEAGAAVGTVELSPDCLVRRAKSRTRPNAFAVFSHDEPRKPRVLLAAPTIQDAQVWMDKIKDVLNADKVVGSETLLKDLYSVTVVTTELSRKCGLNTDSVVTLSANGLLLSRAQKLGAFIEWKYILDVNFVVDKNGICILHIHSKYPSGGGELKLSSPVACELAGAVRLALGAKHPPPCKKLSKSDGDLHLLKCSDDLEPRRSSWYYRPSEISLDDTDLVISKESKRIPSGQLSRCSATDSLIQNTCVESTTSLDDSMSDRRSLLSIASGVYEEIPDLPSCDGDGGGDGDRDLLEPTYESVSECVYATMRRSGKKFPPPLPPRLPFGTMKAGESWTCVNSREVTRHGSLGSLARDPGGEALRSRTLPKPRQPFSVFRKRLKSDSRIVTKPEPKDIETKKKKFDFTPSRDLFKNFKVGKRMKNLKITSNLAKVGETKSCEFLDETEHLKPDRCSKSVECLENEYPYDELSFKFNDEVLNLPQEIVDLILRSREQINKVRLKETQISLPIDMIECEYMPMSPVVPPPIDHYIVMSPRTNLA